MSASEEMWSVTSENVKRSTLIYNQKEKREASLKQNLRTIKEKY